MSSFKSISVLFLLCITLPMSTLAAPVSTTPEIPASELSHGTTSSSPSTSGHTSNQGSTGFSGSPSGRGSNQPSSINAEDNGNSRTTNLLSDLDIGNDIANVVGNKILNDNLNGNELLSENTLGDISLVGRGESENNMPVHWQG